MMRCADIVDKVKAYNAEADAGLFSRAYHYTVQSHGKQKRDSGEWYYEHPLAVASILAGMKLDSSSIVTGMLHDVIEDTSRTRTDIENAFGSEVAALVEGVTKLSRLILPLSSRRAQAENFRKLVLAMSGDIRVLLVKLADRLHNMRTLQHIRESRRRRRIALETREIYAPLAQRMGMHDLADELDELTFCELEPEAYAYIVSQLEKACAGDGEATVRRTVSELQSLVSSTGVAAEVVGRHKKPYSVWRKLRGRTMAFKSLFDIVAFRILVEHKEDCYRALGALHCAYKAVPGRFKDYISVPKHNMYRSLHTTVMGVARRPVEVQIRTRRMDEEAEYGVAAHWSYKQGVTARDGSRYLWLRELLSLMEQASNPEEFLENTRLHMFREHVFCFTPRGELMVLPHGATVLDFAYAVHTELGERCVGGRVNGHEAPMAATLNNGDRVEVVDGPEPHVPPGWRNMAKTARAQAGVKRLLRKALREEFIVLGRDILAKGLRRYNLVWNPALLTSELRESLGCDSVEDFYADIGSGIHTVAHLLEGLAANGVSGAKEALLLLETGSEGDGVILKGWRSGGAVHYAHCCHPIAGDAALGVMTCGGGLTVHRRDCAILERLREDHRRLLPVLLQRTSVGEGQTATCARMRVTLVNQPGSLAALSTILGKKSANIANLQLTRRSRETFAMTLEVEVRDVVHFKGICAALRRLPAVREVARV